MSIENFDWQGYMSDIGYAPEQIPNEINDEDLQWLYGLWARDLMEKINYDVRRDPFLSTANEKRAEARKRFLYYASDLAHFFGDEVQPNDPNSTYDPEAFRQHVINNEVQNANLGYYLDTFAASRINEDTDVKYPWLKGLTKDQFKRHFMEQQDIDEAWTSVDDIRNGNFGTLSAKYQEQLARQQGLKGNEKSGHMAALKQGWYEFEKLFGYTAGTLGDAMGVQWLSDIGNEIAQNVIQKSDAYNYQSKYNESLADTIKNQGFMAAGGKILNMAEENWATTAAPLALAAIGKVLSTYAHVPQPLADAATRAVAANVVRRQGANLLRRASQLAYASSAALSGLEIGGVRAELEEHGKYDPNNVADVVAAGLVSSSLDFVGNVAAMKGIGITASRLWTHRLAVNEARARLAREIAEDQAKSFTHRVLSAMAIEGGIEGLQEIPAMVVGARRGIEYTPKQVRDRIIDAAAVGAFMGGGIRIGEIALEKYHRGDGDDTPTPTSTEQEPGETPEAAPQTEPQPPPPGFDGAIPPFVTWRQMENGFSVHDEFNVGYGATHEEAARNFIDNANKGRVDIDPNRITFVPGSQAGESWVIARYGENGKNSIKVSGQDKERYIRKIIELHNDPKNAINLQGDNVFRTDEFRSNNPQLNEDEFIRSILEQKKTKFGSGSRVTAARRDTVDIPVSFDALPRGERPGTYVTFNLDEDTRSSLRDKGFTILSEPRSKKKGRVQVLRLHRDGFIYTVTLTNNERDQGARANVKAESIYNLVHGKKGGGFSFEGDIDEQVLRVVDTDAVTNLSTSREVKYAVTLSPTLRPGFIEIDRKITPEGREGFTFDPRDVLKKRVEAAKGKIENLGERNISYTSGGETTRLDITADGRVLVSRDGRFIGDYDFVAGDIGDGTERAIVQSSRIEGQQLFHVVDIPEELQFEGRVTFVYRDDLIGGKVTREYFAIKNDGSVHFIPPAEMNYVDKLLRLPHIQNLNDARDVFGHQMIEFYAEPVRDATGAVIGYSDKTFDHNVYGFDLTDQNVNRFTAEEVDGVWQVSDLFDLEYRPDFVKVYAIIAPNGEIVRATTEEGVDAFISDIKNYANIIDDSEWNPSSRGESIFGEAYTERGLYTERDLYGTMYEAPLYGESVTDEEFNTDSDAIRKAAREVVNQIKRDLTSLRKLSRKTDSLISKDRTDQFEFIAADLSQNLEFYDTLGDGTSQFVSSYLNNSPGEFNEAVRRKLYRLRAAQAILRIDLYRANLGGIINKEELDRILTDDIGDYNASDTMEHLRERAIQAESIAVRLEEAYVDFMRSSQATQTANLLWEAIYPDSTEAKYGSFVDRIHSEGTDFRFSRAAETPRVQRKINLLDELNNDIGTFTLNEMLERGLRGESGGLVILPDQEAAHEIERRFTTDATQPYYDNAGLIQGFVAPDGIMYLVEDGIVDGKARQIILHEYGVHARKFGMSDAEFQEVVQGIKARREEKSTEGDFIRNCITRARRANRNMSEDNPIFWEEVAAYAVEDGYHLADTGIVGRMQTWMKNWLWRFGVIDASAFHYQDFVNMAQGMLGNPGPLSFFDGTHDYTKYQDSWKNLPKFSRSVLAEDSPDREEFAQRTYRRLRGLDDAIDRERNGEDADSIEQATDWRRNDQGDWNFRYSVAGEIGAARLDALEEVTTRMDNLVVARDMEQAEKDTKAIKFATGWYRGKDGKWRYEMSNNLDKLTDEFEKIALRIVSYDVHRYFNKEGVAPYYIENLVEKEGKGDFLRNIADSYEPLNPGVIFDKANYKMSEIFSSPDLFGAYPELADMTVYITGILFGYDTVAFYSSNDKTITLNERFVTQYILNKLGLESVRAEDMRNSLLHEIQHYIQDVEGFSRGTSVHYLQKKLQDSESYKIIESYEDEKDKIEKELRGRDASYLKRYRNYLSRIYYLLFLDFINNNDNYHFNENGVLVWNNDDEPVTLAESNTFHHFRMDGDEVITKDNLKNIIDRVLEVQIFNIGYAPPISLSSSYVFKNPTLPIIYGDFTEYIYDNFDNYFGTEESEFVSEIEEKEKRIVFLQNKINEEYTKFFGKEGITSSNAAYRASMGESEARMVEKRSTLTSEELRDRYIEEDMNVPLKDQIDTDIFYDEVISDSLVRYSRATAEELKPYGSFINTLENDLVSQRISGVPNEGDTILYQRGDVNEFITRDSLYTIEDADDYYPDLEQRWIDYHRDDSESNFVRYSRSIPETNGFRYSIFGPEGAAEYLGTRDYEIIAQQMRDAGKDAKTIKFATGYEYDEDKQAWVYEVSNIFHTLNEDALYNLLKRQKFDMEKGRDENLLLPEGERYLEFLNTYGYDKLIEENGELITDREFFSLPYVFNAPDIYEAYPGAENIKVFLNADMGSILASYNPRLNYISISARHLLKSFDKGRVESLKETILHEVQHYIQAQEGFEGGTSVEAERYRTSFISQDYGRRRAEIESQISNLEGDFRSTLNKFAYNNIIDYLEKDRGITFDNNGHAHYEDGEEVRRGYIDFYLDNEDDVLRKSDLYYAMGDAFINKKIKVPEEVSELNRILDRFFPYFNEFLHENNSERWKGENADNLIKIIDKIGNLNKEVANLNREEEEKFREFYKDDRITNELYAYIYNPGEIEARRVEDRMNMTQAEISENLISSSPIRFSRAATIDDVPQTARQRGTQVPNASGMYKMPDGSLHIEPSELPVGFESETILYAAIAISDPAKEEPKVAELRNFITADENLMRLTDQMMEQRKDTNEDHRLGYAVSLILEAYDPASDIYQQTVDAFHEAVSKATGGAYQNLILDTGQIEAAAHATAGIPYEPLLTAPQETVPTPRPNTADMEHLRRQEMFAASDAQRAEMQVGEDGRAYISTDDSDVDVVFESKVNTPFDTGRLVDDVLIGASRQGEDDDFYNHLADSPHHGTQEPLDSGRFALPADQHRQEVERFLADSIPEHIWRRVEILWEDNAENNAILGNALGLFKPRSWKNKNIFIKGWNRSFGQVVRTAAREASRFGWGMWQNRDFRRAITEFYDMFQAKIYDELRPYYNQMGITDPAQLSDGQKIYMVQTFFSKMNQSLFTDDQGNMGDLLGIPQTEYRRILADVRSGVAAQERDLSAFVEGVANDPELAKRFAAEMLRMTMEASTKMGVHFTYERSSRLGGKDRIRVFTNEWGTYRRKIPNTRFGKAAEEIKNNLRWWRERFNAGEGAEKFARQMMRNLPMSMKYPLKWMHLYVPHARLGDTTLGRASQMISRVWQRIGDTSGTTLARDYALMEDIHGILRAHNYDPLMADDMGNRTYREFFQGLGITSEKDLKKADMADAIVTTAERLKTEGEAKIRETIMETGLSLWNRMLDADFSQRDINKMVNRFEGYRQRFMLDHYSHRMYEAFTPEGKRELSMLLNYLRRDPRTGEHTLAKRAKEARDAIARAQARYGAATSEFYRETKEARDDLRRWERLQHLWNREMGNAKKYKGLVGAELNAKVVEGMERYILAIVSDSKTHGRFDPQAVPHYNAISAQKARNLDPDNPLDKELMDFLLEIKDPIRNAVYTLDQQRQLITKLEFNKELGEYLLDNNMAGLRSQPDADGLARDLAHMETGSFLEYVNVDPEFMPEIKAEWENMQKVSDTVLSGLTDAVKANSTVYSLRLMMNNYLGNASMLLASGHIWRFKDYLTAGEVIRKQFLDRFTYGAKDPSDFAKMILREMEQNMVTGGSGTEMSVFQLNKGAHERFVQTMTQMLYAVTPLTKRGKFKMDNFVAKLLEKARAFYTYGDEWVKPLIYLNNRASAIAKYQAIEKRYDGETEEDYQERVLRKAIEEASEQTIRETVSWENSPFFVRQLSTRSVRFFAPDFLLHNFQMLRITAANYVRWFGALDELRNFDPSEMNPDKVEAYRSELKKELVRRGVGGAMTAGVYAGLIGATGSCMAYIPYMMNTLMAAIDGEDDKDKDNTFFNPQEWEGAQRILNYKTGGDNFFVPAWKDDGKIYAWNYGRASVMLTHAITQPATENPEFTDYAAQFFKNIVAIGGGTIAQEIVNNFQGKDKWGRDIGVEAGWWRIFDRVFVPGAVKQLTDMSVGYPGSDNPYREGKAIKMSDAVGITVNAYDMRDIVNELAWDMARVGSNSQNVVRKSFVKRLTQSDALSDSDVASMIGDMREDNARHMDRANYLLTGLRQMGMENKELQHWLTTSRKDAGNILSKKQATAFLKGHNVYDDALVTYLKNKRNNLAKGKDDVRMSREELGVVLQNYDKAIRIYSQALRPQ